MDDAVRRALEITAASTAAERTVDITTTGAKTGRQLRIEIWLYAVDGDLYLTRVPGLPPAGWLANLLANPRFILHLKHGVTADLPAIAHPIGDPALRERVFGEMITQLSRMSAEGSVTPPKPLERWLAESPLVRVELE